MGELAGLSTPEDTNNGFYAQALCEGCGPTLVDHEGNCRYHDCLQKHGAAEDKPAMIQNLTAADWKFLTYCLGSAYAQTATADEATRNYIKENHDRVAAKVSAALAGLGQSMPSALVTTESGKVEPAALVIAHAELTQEHKDGIVDELLYRLAQPVVDHICECVKQRKLDEAKAIVVEHASVSPEIAQQFIDYMVRDWEKHSGSQPT